MNYISILHFASLIVDILLLVYVLRKRPQQRLNRLCALMITSMAIMSLSFGLIPLAGYGAAAIALVNLGMIGFSAGPVIALWFTLALAKKDSILNNKVFTLISFILPLSFILIQWTNSSSIVLEQTNWGTAVIWPASPYVSAFLIYALSMFFLCGILLLGLIFKAKTSRQKKQAAILFITGIVSVSLTAVSIVLTYQFGMKNVPQVPDILFLFLVIGIVLAISKYGLMTINPVLASDEILSTMSDSLMLLNNEGTIVFANRSACSLLDLRGSNLTGRNFITFAENDTQAHDLLDETRRSGIVSRELNLISGGGTITPVLVSTSVIKESNGEVAGFVISAADMRQQKMDEAKLAAHQQLINGILETMPSAVLVINQQMEVVFANKLFFQGMGWAEGQVEGRPLLEVIPSEEFIAQISSAVLVPAGNVQFEFRYDLNGNSRILVASIISMPAENILLILNDVTSERERQDRLYLTDRLASIGEMAAGVAHEMNNPLTSVLGLSKLLTEQDLPGDMGEDLNTIYKESLRVSNIVKNLLTFARKRAPVKQPAQIHGVIDDILKLRAYEHKVSNIFVTRNFADNLPDVTIDYNQMQQVFVNIVLNAEYEMIQAHNGGSLIITTKNLDDRILISFKDDGPGISHQNLKRMFDPFFTTKESGKGTGLGLSVCYGIVANHGGKIYVESNLGQGATFIVELPATVSASETALQTQISNYLKKKTKIQIPIYLPAQD
ncbi:MAG: ATP-binding protein [Dehalococcoidia bacterium]|jgi:PAS domain S-box-containing protein